MAEVTEIKCVNPRCRQPVTLLKPAAEVLRGEQVTVVIFAHGGPQRCASCGQPYLPVLTDMGNLNFVWRPVASQADPVILRGQNDANHTKPSKTP